MYSGIAQKTLERKLAVDRVPTTRAQRRPGADAQGDVAIAGITKHDFPGNPDYYVYRQIVFAAVGLLVTCVDVTGRKAEEPQGDGTPLEEGGAIRWRPISEVLALCRSGEIADAKTELAIGRFLDSR